MGFKFIFMLSLATTVASLSLAGGLPPTPSTSTAISPLLGQAAVGRESAVFIENGGQWNSSARYMMQGKSVNLWLTAEGARYQFPLATKDPRKTKSMAIGMSFEGGATLKLNAARQLPGVVNYLHYGKQNVNITGLHRYADVEARNVYPGIDVRFSSTSSLPRYDLIVNPGADPAKIALKFDGVRAMAKRAGGIVEMQTPAGVLRHKALSVYQGEGKARKQVSCGLEATGNVLRFHPGSYDHTKPLIIDPIIEGTYFGTGNESLSQGVRDSYGDIVLGGTTSSSVFPVTLGNSPTNTQGAQSGFVSVLTSDLGALIYSTYVGGGDTGTDFNGAGYSTNTGVGALTSGKLGSICLVLSSVSNYTGDGTSSVGYNLLKLDPTGKQLSSTNLYSNSASDNEYANATSDFHIAVTPNGDIICVSNLQTEVGGFSLTPTILKVSGSTGTLTTYPFPNSGSFPTSLRGVATDNAGDFYICGNTSDPSLPAIAGSYQSALPGTQSAFIALVTPAVTGIQAATYLGGSSFDEAHALKVDSLGNIVCAGMSSSANFPTTPSAISSTLVGKANAFVARLTPNLKTLVSSTLLGGSGTDNPSLLEIGADNSAWISGSTDSPNFPVTAQAEHPSSGSVFISGINPAGSLLQYSSKWYGNYVAGLQLDPLGTLLLEGGVNGLVPTTPNALQATAPGKSSLFVSKFSPATQPAPSITRVIAAPMDILGGKVGAGYVYLKAPAPDGGVLVTLRSSNPTVVSIPAAIVIPGGQTFGTFKIDTISVAKPTNATIAASAGLSTGSGAITVLNVGLQIYFDSNDQHNPQNSEVIGGNDTYVTVATRLSTGLKVNLSSSGSAAMPPQTVTIPVGSNLVVVRIPTTGVAAVASVTLVAQVGVERAITSLKLDPASVYTLVISPSPVVGGAASLGRLNLGGNAPSSGAVVTLSSDSPNIVVPASVKVPPFANTVAFPIATKGVSATVHGNVSATLKGNTITSPLVVNPATLKSLTLDQATVKGGGFVIATVKLTGFAGPTGYTVTTSSNSAVATVPASVKVLGGTSLFAFRVNTKAVTKATNVVVTAKVGTLVFTAPLTVTP